MWEGPPQSTHRLGSLGEQGAGFKGGLLVVHHSDTPHQVLGGPPRDGSSVPAEGCGSGLAGPALPESLDAADGEHGWGRWHLRQRQRQPSLRGGEVTVNRAKPTTPAQADPALLEDAGQDSLGSVSLVPSHPQTPANRIAHSESEESKAQQRRASEGSKCSPLQEGAGG